MTDTPAAPSLLDKAILSAIADITVPPGDLLIGTGKYEVWAVKAFKRRLALNGFDLSESAPTRDDALAVLRRELQVDENGDNVSGAQPEAGWETGYCAGIRTAYRILKKPCCLTGVPVDKPCAPECTAPSAVCVVDALRASLIRMEAAAADVYLPPTPTHEAWEEMRCASEEARELLAAAPVSPAPKRTNRPSYAEVAGAIARGWCSPNNAHKEMDSDLAFAIAVQVSALLDERESE